MLTWAQGRSPAPTPTTDRPTPPATTPLRDDAPVGVKIAGGAVAVVLAALVAAPIPARQADVRLLVVAVAIGLFAGVASDAVAAAVVVTLGWLVVNGFLVDRLGQLDWHGSSDAVRLAVLAGSAAIGLLVAQVRARRRSRREHAETG